MAGNDEKTAVCQNCGAQIDVSAIIGSDRAGGTSSSDASGNPPAELFSDGFTDPETEPDVLSIADLARRLANKGVIGTDDELSFLLERLNYRTVRKYSDAIVRRAPANALTAGNILVLAHFDRALQSVMLQGIASIELQFRAVYGRLMAESGGPFAHHCRDNFKNDEHYDEFVEAYGRELSYKLNSRSVVNPEDFALYHDVPIWQAVEILGLGTISKLYRNTRDRDVRKGVADSFGVKYEHLTSWLRTICEVRNRCAHFEDVCVTPVSCKPKKVDGITARNDTAFYACAVINRLIEGSVSSIESDIHEVQVSKFLYHLELLTNDVPEAVFLVAGFPKNWAKQLANSSLHVKTLYKRYWEGNEVGYYPILKKH